MKPELLQHVFYINLSHRTDRRKHIEEELTKLNVTNPTRCNAITHSNGAVGCTLSHIWCLEQAKINSLPYACIIEDDAVFTNPELILKNIKQFEDSSIEWDVLLLGGNVNNPFDIVNDFCIRSYNTQTTVSYIVNSHYYDTLINNFKESAFNLNIDPNNRDAFACDMYWKHLQKKDKWFMIIPLTVTQLRDFSDIENKYVNYDTLMLNLYKTWVHYPPS